jgi:RND family efflux transporter, MFP subunit
MLNPESTNESGEGTRRIISIDGGVKPRGSKAKKTKTILVFVALIAGIAALVLVLGSAGKKKTATISGYAIGTVEKTDFVKTTDASGTVVLPESIAVPCPEEGYASSLSVAEGDSVKSGQVVAVLSVPTLVNDLDYYRASLAAAKVDYKSLETDYDYQIATAATSMKRYDDKIAEQQKTVDNKKALLALKSSKQSDYDTAVDALTALQQSREDAESSKSDLEAKKLLALKKQQATIDQYQAQYDRTATEVESARIKAPMSGEVLSISAKLSVPGSLLLQNDTLMTIANRSDTYIDFAVGEQYVSFLKPGDKLTATIGATTLAATIATIGKTATMSSDGLTSTVTVRTRPQAGTSLTPGASATATVTLGTKPGALVLPRGAYLTTGGQKYIYKVEGSKAVKTKVEFGDVEGAKVEIVSGLSAGDKVIMSGYTDFIDDDVVELASK